ncbi:hypothetical protein C2G38_2189655 [Gigaspora rosea]|uniref:Uncharacterized protein n=1 Tax=Gigaspora rosea TaxID=44941 RepID=A0A397V263_9GLOM|nr:hypothetical protein C2G38_2189655 [Gigaspora rosea]
MNHRVRQISIDHLDMLVISCRAVAVCITIGVIVGVIFGVIVGFTDVAIRFLLDLAVYISQLWFIDMESSLFIIGVVVASASFLVLFVIGIADMYYVGTLLRTCPGRPVPDCLRP